MKDKMVNLHIFYSPMLNESRFLKISGSLISLGLVDEVIVYGKGEKGLLREEVIDENRRIIRGKSVDIDKSTNFLLRVILVFYRLISYITGGIRHTKKIKPQIITCHNLLFLPFAVFLSRIAKSKLVYEPHELETEKTGVSNKMKKILRILEKRYIKYADKVVVVCDPILDWYKDEYNLSNIYTIRNVPINPYLEKERENSTILKNKFNIKKDDILLIYQGVISSARGIDLLLDVSSKIDSDKHIVFMGYGDKVDTVKEYAAKYENIHYQEAVAVNEIIKYSSSADIGVHFIQGNISLSYTYSLPNKFFEYLLGGLPVFVSSNLEHLSTLIQENNLGWVLNDQDNEGLSNFINNLTIKELESKQKSIKEYNKSIGWQLEENVLKEVYDFKNK